MLKICFVLLVLFDGGLGSVTKIAKENSIKKAAQEAFLNKDYKTAIQNFSLLTDSLKVVDENATLNLGHSYYRLNDLETASKTYEKLYSSRNPEIRSIAAQQLGVLSFKADQDKEKALTYFKEALRANPDNAEARYNYEFLKKLQKAKEDPKMDNKNKDDKKDDKKEGDNKDQQNQDNKDQKGNDKKDGKDSQKDQKGKDGKSDKNKDSDKGDKNSKNDENAKDQKKDGKGDKSDDKNDKKNGGDKEGGNKDKEEKAKGNKDKNGENAQGKDEKKPGGKEDEQGNAMKEKQGGKKEKEKIVANPEVLAKMGMTDARAKMILDAMKSSEVQYIQQQKREPAKKQKKGKPDW
jgi:hypothetical protein